MERYIGAATWEKRLRKAISPATSRTNTFSSEGFALRVLIPPEMSFTTLQTDSAVSRAIAR